MNEEIKEAELDPKKEEQIIKEIKDQQDKEPVLTEEQKKLIMAFVQEVSDVCRKHKMEYFPTLQIRPIKEEELKTE